MVSQRKIYGGVSYYKYCDRAVLKLHAAVEGALLADSGTLEHLPS